MEAEVSPIKSVYVTLQFSFPQLQQPKIVSKDVATKCRQPESLSHSLEESYLEELLFFSALAERKQ